MPRVSRKAHAMVASVSTAFALRTYKTAIYARLSLEDVRKKISDSIGTQKAMLLNYIQTQSDMELHDIYADINYTGTNFNRPEFSRMMEDIHAGLVDCVVVKDLSRFGRSFEEMGHYLERVFPFLKVRFVSVNDSYDSLTATPDESCLMVPLKNLMNTIYARDISKKTRAGKKAKQQRGEYSGSFAPYGYIMEGSSFDVDDEAAPVVRQIFTWVLEGFGDVAIAQKLNEMQITPPSRYRFEKGITKGRKHEETKFWYKSAIKRMTENPVYIGTLALGKFHSDSTRSGGAVMKNRDEWVAFENAHPAIIDSDTFNAVQAIKQARKEKSKLTEAKRTTQPNIFKGLIFCGDCGCPMSRKQRRAKYSFVCTVYDEVSKHSCTLKSLREADLHSAVFEYISREIQLCVDMTRIVEDLKKRSAYQDRRAMLQKQISKVQNKLEENRRFRGSLREDLKDGILTQQDYAAMKADYDREREQLQQELDMLIEMQATRDNTLSPENKWIAEFLRFETEQQLSAQMVTALIECIDVYDGGRVEITLRYRDEFEKPRETAGRSAYAELLAHVGCIHEQEAQLPTSATGVMAND